MTHNEVNSLMIVKFTLAWINKIIWNNSCIVFTRATHKVRSDVRVSVKGPVYEPSFIVSARPSLSLLGMVDWGHVHTADEFVFSSAFSA